jgi:hypothetical protein
VRITLQDAVAIVQRIEPKLAAIGYHTALTGGCLYNGGSEKDVDIIVYPHDPSKLQLDETLQTVFAETGFIDRYEASPDYVNRRVWIYGYEGVRVDFFMS